jgi:orotidine-5'-phosphate decarboxylase
VTAPTTPPAASPEPPAPFGDRLAAAVAARESQVVLGLDPDPEALWPASGDGAQDALEALAAALQQAVTAGRAHGAASPPRPGGERAATRAAEVLAHCVAVIDAAGEACVAVKPQLACFERLGAGGLLAYEAVAAHARAAGLLVLADGKRGDVPVSATAYAQAYFSDADVPADALTVNPLLGRDALAPLADAAAGRGAGLFVLVRTSNPGAADLMDLRLASGETLWERLASLVAEVGEPTLGPASGLAAIGAVTGATRPEHLARMRELLPRAPFLLPGIGAQGGRVEDLAPAFAPGRAAGLVTASRAIVNAHRQSGGAPAAAARAEAERLRETAWALV